MPGSTKAVSSSPPMASSSTCSPSEGAHQTRERPARQVSQFSQVVFIPPVWTRQSPLLRSTSVTTPIRIRLRIARAMPFMEVNVFMRRECRSGGTAATRRGFLRDDTTSGPDSRRQAAFSAGKSVLPLADQLAVDVQRLRPRDGLRQRRLGGIRRVQSALILGNKNSLG
ncbi:hypothetical protein DI57_00050 [Enterobacter asburiae L1]|nr:hypothetical protein DI57_00050 [Enterobacter asburiae L1]